MEPKAQCRACLTYWSADIVYCTCGHLMKDDTTENKKYILSVLDLFSIPNFYIRKGRTHGHRYGKAPGCKEYHTANQLQKRCRKKKYDNIGRYSIYMLSQQVLSVEVLLLPLTWLQPHSCLFVEFALLVDLQEFLNFHPQ